MSDVGQELRFGLCHSLELLVSQVLFVQGLLETLQRLQVGVVMTDGERGEQQKQPRITEHLSCSTTDVTRR